MKKIFIVILVSIITRPIFCQQTNLVPELTKHDYWQKSKNQKTAAFILLGSGIALSGVSFTMLVAHASVDAGTGVINGLTGAPPPPKRSYKTESTLLILGSTAILSSIPLFIASAKNKKKTIQLSFENKMVQQVQNRSFVKIPVPSLSVHISL